MNKRAFKIKVKVKGKKSVSVRGTNTIIYKSNENNEVGQVLIHNAEKDRFYVFCGHSQVWFDHELQFNYEEYDIEDESPEEMNKYIRIDDWSTVPDHIKYSLNNLFTSPQQYRWKGKRLVAYPKFMPLEDDDD